MSCLLLCVLSYAVCVAVFVLSYAVCLVLCGVLCSGAVVWHGVLSCLVSALLTHAVVRCDGVLSLHVTSCAALSRLMRCGSSLRLCGV